MGTVADLLVVVVYCLGFYTLLGVVAGLFEWWVARPKRMRRQSMAHPVFSQGRPRRHWRRAPGRTGGLSGVYGP